MVRSPGPRPPDDPRLAEIKAWVGCLDGTLRTAEALVRAARGIDLAGLEASAGRLCAASLDLPPQHAASLRAMLVALLARLDLLEAALRGDGRPGGADASGT